MKERPILLSGEMVRAVLEGRKTQTRRPVANVQRNNCVLIKKPTKRMMGIECHVCDLVNLDTRELGYNPPYGTVHDHLWVRETHAVYSDLRGDGAVYFNADGEVREQLCAEHGEGDPVGLGAVIPRELRHPKPFRWTPSIHMPRWAARLLLEITAVRVERVQEINGIEAWDEGCPYHPKADPSNEDIRNWFAGVWNAAYPGSWERNDWVWVIEFKRI